MVFRMLSRVRPSVVQVTESDPFNRQRSTRFEFRDKPRGSPYAGLKERELERFLARKAKEYERKY